MNLNPDFPKDTPRTVEVTNSHGLRITEGGDYVCIEAVVVVDRLLPDNQAVVTPYDALGNYGTPQVVGIDELQRIK